MIASHLLPADVPRFTSCSAAPSLLSPARRPSALARFQRELRPLGDDWASEPSSELRDKPEVRVGERGEEDRREGEAAQLTGHSMSALEFRRSGLGRRGAQVGNNRAAAVIQLPNRSCALTYLADR